MGKETPKVEVVDYYLGVHFALCHGPIDSVQRVIVKEKEAWAGKQTVYGGIKIEKSNLFGGNKKEGGVKGTITFLPGNDDQRLPAVLAAKFRRYSSTMPAYRGIATLFFSSALTPAQLNTFSTPPAPTMLWGAGPGAEGGSGQFVGSGPSFGFDDLKLDGQGGFMWSSNNPYLPETWVKASRRPRGGLSSGLAAIENLVPEAIIGLPEEEEEPEEDDDTPQPVDDAENEEPLNGYYIGGLPTETEFIKTQYGYKGTDQSVIDDPLFERRIFDVYNQDKLKIAGCVYRNYGDDANPSHMIFEAMTNKIWGMGSPETAFNIPIWNAAAQTLFDEKFGMSFLWSAQSSIESTVSEILDHIQGMVYINPRTGLFDLKLLRADYDVSTLRVLTPDNADLTSFSRKAWGETINEIVLTWTNPENEKESTVTLQDLGNIGVQGAIVSDSRNYYGIRNASLAMKVCARDLRTASAPLASFEGELDRDAWDILPGEVIRVQWPDEGIEDAVFRIMDVDYGKIGSPSIKVRFVEDFFALPTQGYTVGAGPRPVKANMPAGPLDYLSFYTMPYQLAARFNLGEGVAYPNVGVLVLGADADNGSIESFLLSAETTTPTGSVSLVESGTPRITTHGLFPQPLAKEFTSTVAVISAETRNGGEPQVGGLVIIGSTDAEHEIGLITAISPETGVTFSRGMLDTVPRAWPASTPLWVIEYATFNGFDSSYRTADVPTDYAIRPQTDEDILDAEDAQERTFTPSERPYCPTRPANCMVGGERFLKVYTTRPATISVTWANRNRLMEDAVFPAWTLGNVTPEPGQTTTIRFFNESGAMEQEVTGLTGTSTDIVPSATLTGGAMLVKFYAVRDGFESIQAYSVTMAIPYQPGFGYGFGGKFGE